MYFCYIGIVSNLLTELILSQTYIVYKFINSPIATHFGTRAFIQAHSQATFTPVVFPIYVHNIFIPPRDCYRSLLSRY